MTEQQHLGWHISCVLSHQRGMTIRESQSHEVLFQRGWLVSAGRTWFGDDLLVGQISDVRRKWVVKSLQNWWLERLGLPHSFQQFEGVSSTSSASLGHWSLFARPRGITRVPISEKPIELQFRALDGRIPEDQKQIRKCSASTIITRI